jgi:integral membrane protein (TIGR01906 family)
MTERKNIRILFYIAAVFFILCVPFFLITSNIRWVANDLQLYQDGFEKYDVSQDTGFSDEELVNITKGLIDYFNSGAIDETMDIFSDNEIIHLRDVRGLVQLCYIIQWTALGYIIVFITVGFIYKRRQFFHLFNIVVAAGSIASILGIAVIGIAALVDFNWLFVTFHRLFFSNDLWISSGYLPRIYTEGFFYDAAKILAIATVLEALLLGVITGFFILRRRRLRNQ